jgi:hypothetical protein
MLVWGMPRRTFYLSRSGERAQLSMFVPRIPGKGNVMFSPSSGSQKGEAEGKVAALAFVQHFRQLEALHRAGYCHYDVKGDNFMFDRATNTGTLIDFGTLCRPWQPRAEHWETMPFSLGWSFCESTYSLPGADEALKNLINSTPNTFFPTFDPRKGRDVLFSHLGVDGASYKRVKEAQARHKLSILGLFGVHFDMSCLLKYGALNCKLLNDDTKKYFEECVRSCCHPYHVSRLAQYLIDRYQLGTEASISLDPIRTLNLESMRFDEMIRIDPSNARLSDKNLEGMLRGVETVGDYYHVKGGEYGGTVLKGTKSLMREEFEDWDEVSDEEQMRRRLKKNVWFESFARKLSAIKGTWDSSTQAGETMSDIVDKILDLVSGDLFTVEVFSLLITALLLTTLVASGGGMGGPFYDICQLMMAREHKEKLQKYWDPEISTVESVVTFLRLVKRKAMIHEHFRPVFDRSVSSEDKLSTLIEGAFGSRGLDGVEGNGDLFNFETGKWELYDGGRNVLPGTVGGGTVDKKRMLSSIRRETSVSKGKTLESVLAPSKKSSVESNIDPKTLAINTIQGWIKAALFSFFAPNTIEGIEEYFEDVATAYTSPPTTER